MAKYLSEDGLRYFYNQIKSKFAAANHNHDAGNVTSGTLPITRGGTGQTTAAGLRNALGLGNTTGAVPVANGGTGATSVAEAVKALLGSSSIGSSTKPLYYDGAALKACADSIGGGGIVAQLLEQNGYVKFANGLILQWGVINSPNFPDSGQPVTFPIKFSRIPSVLTAANQAKNSSAAEQLFTAAINTYTTTSNMIMHRYYGLTNSDARVDWFAWGV